MSLTSACLLVFPRLCLHGLYFVLLSFFLFLSSSFASSFIPSLSSLHFSLPFHFHLSLFLVFHFHCLFLSFRNFSHPFTSPFLSTAHSSSLFCYAHFCPFNSALPSRLLDTQHLLFQHSAVLPRPLPCVIHLSILLLLIPSCLSLFSCS